MKAVSSWSYAVREKVLRGALISVSSHTFLIGLYLAHRIYRHSEASRPTYAKSACNSILERTASAFIEVALIEGKVYFSVGNYSAVSVWSELLERLSPSVRSERV